MKAAREYCCCAIPLVNSGIYITLIEQFFASLLIGIVSVATPSIVGAATPSYAPLLLAVFCFIVTAVQPLGFIGVSKEKTLLYRRYVTLHGISISAAFSLAGAWVIVSAARHSKAQSKCIQDFFSSTGSETEGEILCNIFSWVDVGIMGALWVLLAILQGYLFIILSAYGRAQRGERGQYDRLYDPSQPLTENIPLGPTGHTDPWDSRRSIEAQEVSDRKYHDRTSSTLSGHEYLNNPNPEFPKYDPSYGYTSNAKRGAADNF